MNTDNEKERSNIKVAWYENNMPFVDTILYYFKKRKFLMSKFLETRIVPRKRSSNINLNWLFSIIVCPA